MNVELNIKVLGGQVVVRSGNEEKVFCLKENLDQALELLKKINGLTTVEGVPVYETRMYKGVSTWSFHQQLLFLPILREYIMYRDCVEYVCTKTRESYSIMLSGDTSKLEQYLNFLGLEYSTTHPRHFAKKAVHTFVGAVGRVLARAITYVALMKSALVRPKVVLYTPDKYNASADGDFRFQHVYSFLKKEGQAYLEVMHTTFGKEFLFNIFKRRRCALYLEAFLPFFLPRHGTIEYNLSSFPEYERNIVKNILREIDKRAVASELLIRKLLKAIHMCRGQMFISMDDPRYVNELVVACRELGLATYAFQHGHITLYHAGWMNYGIPAKRLATFDVFFAWNTYWLNSLLAHSSGYTALNATVGGPLRLPAKIEYAQRKKPIKSISDVGVLVPYESLAPKDELKDLFRILKAGGARMYFKVRPDVSVEAQLKEYALSHEDVEVVEKLDSNILSKVDIAIGVYTTFLYDMMFYEKPVCVYETSFTLGQSLVDDGVAKILPRIFEPARILEFVNNYTSVKSVAWPEAPRIYETLEKIAQKKYAV